MPEPGETRFTADEEIQEESTAETTETEEEGAEFGKAPVTDEDILD